MNNNPKIFGLIGTSISSSLSPAIFEYLFKKYKIVAGYHLFSLDRGQLKSAVEGMRVLGIRGLNVTAPFKEKAMSYLDSVDGQAKQIGAVNVIRNQDGKLVGYNTDVIGIKKTLEEKLDIRKPPSTAVLIGAGGAARACLAVMQRQKPGKILIFNRSLERARILATSAEDGVRAHSLEDLSGYLTVSPPDLIVNATSGNSFSLSQILPRALSAGSTVFDLNYQRRYRVNPSNRNNYCDGLFMLACQAVETFRIWFGAQADAEEAYRYLLKRKRE